MENEEVQSIQFDVTSFEYRKFISSYFPNNFFKNEKSYLKYLNTSTKISLSQQNYWHLGYDKLCVSYGATWYNDCFAHSNPDMGKALGRVRFVQELLEMKRYKSTKFHLLGCAIPQEFGWYDNHPQIESIDTSNPVMAALEGIAYNEKGLDTKPKANMNDHFDMDFKNISYELIMQNTYLFRKINGLRPYPEHTGSFLKLVNNE